MLLEFHISCSEVNFDCYIGYELIKASNSLALVPYCVSEWFGEQTDKYEYLKRKLWKRIKNDEVQVTVFKIKSWCNGKVLLNPRNKWAEYCFIEPMHFFYFKLHSAILSC